jgi:hypothetical protein
MIRNSIGFVAILIVIVVLAGPAPAQFAGQGVGAKFLLFNKSVQDELKLTPDQLNKLRADAETVLGGFKDQLTRLKEMETQARAKIMSMVNDKTTKIVTTVLDKEQVKRLREIDLQQRGPLALFDEDVRKNLNITEEQVNKAKTIADTSFQDLHKAYEAKDEKKMTEILQAANQQVTDILTPEQKKTWQEMTGRPFTIKVDRD